MAISDRIRVWYELDDNTDSHGAGPNFTEVNSPSYITGLVGNAVDTDSSAQSYLTVANASAGIFQPGTASFSWSVWIYCNTLPGTNSMPVFRFGGVSGASPGINCIVSSTGQISFRFGDGTTLYSIGSATSTISASTWYHVACTIERGGIMRAYVNGALVGSVDISGAGSTDVQSTEDFKLGGLFQNYADAVFDEFMMWDGVMSHDVISILYNGGSGISYSSFSAITRPYVAQEWFYEQETNTTNATAAVSDLTEGNVILAMLSTDGNATGASLTTWDSAFTNIIDATGPSSGTTFTRFRAWWNVITATDVSTETQVAATWTNNEKAVLYVQMWDNCAGVNAANESSQLSSSTLFTEDGVTTDVDGCQIVVGIGIDGGPTVTAYDAGLTFWDYQVTNSAGHSGLWLGSESQATAGATGSYDFTVSGTTHCIPFSIAMEPAATGAGSVSGTITQGGQTFSGTAEVLVQASGSLTQGAATLSGTAGVLAQASGALTQGAVTLSGTAEVLVQASGSLTQGGQVLVGTVGTPALSVSGTITQGAATLSGSAAVTVQASGSLTQGAVSISGSASVLVQLSGSLTQGAATITGSVADPNNGVRDIELSADPYIELSMTAAPLVQITLSAEAYVQ